MHANDVQMARVYTREKDGTILDQTFPEGAEVEVAVDAEAGSTIFGLGAPYSVNVLVRDLNENFEIDYTFTQSGNFGDANWPSLATTFKFVITDTGRLQKGHIFNALASLSVGVADPNVSFAESPMFIIT